MLKIWIALLGLLTNLLWFAPAYAQNQLKSFDITTDITYGDILKELVPQAQTNLDLSLQQKCYPKATQGPYSTQFKARYNCGEIPYGTIVNAKKKRVFQVKVPKGTTLIRVKSNFTEAKKGEAAAGSVTMRNAFEFNVLLDRDQYSSRVTTDLLDEKKSTVLQVKSSIGDTVTIRHRPQGGALYSLVCGYLPGIKIKTQATDVNLDASYTWRVLFFSATERLTALNTIRNGSLANSHAKICGVVKTSVVKNSKGDTLPRVELLDVSYPTFAGLKVQGPGVASTKVVIHTLGLKVVNFFLKLFTRTSIETMVSGLIQETVKKEVDRTIKLHINDIKSGKIFETIMKEALKKTPSGDILKSYTKAIKEAVDVDEISFKQDLVQQCKSLIGKFLSDHGLPANTDALAKTCGGLQMDVSLLPFADNTTFAKRGCYNYPHSPLSYSATGKSTWWMNSCGLSSRIRITAPEKYIDAVKCLTSAKTDAQKTSCVIVLLEDLFKLPEDILDYIDLIDSLQDLRRIAAELGYTEKEIKEIEKTFKTVIKI